MGFTAGGLAAIGAAGFGTGGGGAEVPAFVVMAPAERGGGAMASCCGDGVCGTCSFGRLAYFARSACALDIIRPPSTLCSFMSLRKLSTTGSLARRQCA